MSMTADRSRRIAELEERVRQMHAAIRLLEQERETVRRRRIWNLLIVGVCLSAMAHVGCMIWLSFVRRGGEAGSRAVVEPMALQIAVVHSQELTRLQEIESAELSPEVVLDAQDLSTDDPAATLDPEVSAVSLEVSSGGAVPALGGSGAGEGEGSAILGGGGAGTTFFGVSSRGTRFAYVVDVSGSMGQDNKLDTCLKELARSIQTLPDYSSFFVVLYSSAPRPFHTEWAKARPAAIATLVRWLNDIDPTGGTKPAPAFELVLELENRPDVIFFLTDGIIPAGTPEYVGELNRRGKRVTINTIAFGDPQGQDMLQEIARASGGVYRFVPN